MESRNFGAYHGRTFQRIPSLWTIPRRLCRRPSELHARTGNLYVEIKNWCRLNFHFFNTFHQCFAGDNLPPFTKCTGVLKITFSASYILQF